MKSPILIECPRDAMQGIKAFVPTDRKVAYIQSLLQVGFDTLDFGSFVSPKAIPQMADTKEVLDKIELNSTKLLAIVVNEKGALEEEINRLCPVFRILSKGWELGNWHVVLEKPLYV